MPIITNFLVISMVILTIFVKMVPAPDGIDESIKINHYVTTANLNKFKDLYQTEIQEFCTKQKTPTNDMPAKALFYLKNSFDDFSRINWFLEIGSNVYTNFLILRKETASKGPLDQLYTADNLKNFKQITLTELITIYESATFCSLPNNIQDKLVFWQLYFVHDIENSIQITKGKDRISVEALIENFKNGKESQDAGVPLDIYTQFKENWEFYDFTEDIFNQYNSTFNKTVLEDIDTGGEISYTENGVTKTMGMLNAFLYFFKESLDDNYYMTLHMDTKELDNSQKTFYYNQMLRGMKKIYDLYSVQHGKPKSNSGTDFVQKMVNVAEEIKQKLNITKEITDITGQINEASKTNDGIKLMNHRYTSCYRYNRCGLPSKVYFKDIIQYLIFQIAAPVIDNREEAHIVPAITNSD